MIYRRLISDKLSGSLGKVAKNVSWLLLEKVVLLGLAVPVMILVARHLGPVYFGYISFATAFSSIFGVIVYLGLTGIVVRQIVEEPSDTGEILGTVFFLKIASAIVALALGSAIAAIMIDDWQQRMVVYIVLASLPFDSSVVRLHFEAKVESRRVAIVSSSVAILGMGGRVIAVVLEASVMAFAALITTQAVLTAIGMLPGLPELRRAAFELEI